MLKRFPVLIWILISSSLVTAVPELKIGKVEPSKYKRIYDAGFLSSNNKNNNQSEIQLNGNITRFEIICVNDQPVQWIYEGDGAPQGVNVTATRNRSPSSHAFQLKLTFNIISSMLTGIYTCAPVGGKKISISSKNGEQTTKSIVIYGQDPELEKEHVFLRTLRGQTLDILIPPNLDNVRLPCSVSNSQVEVKLRRVSAKDEFQIVQPNEYLTFSPSSGFRFYKRHEDFKPGVYVCSVDGAEDDSVTINLREQNYEVYPDTEDLRLLVEKNSSDGQNVSCYASNPVKMVIATTADTESRILRFEGSNTNDSIPFAYMASLKLLNVSVADIGSVKCIRELEDGSSDVLHTWKYQTISATKLGKLGWRRSQTSVDGQVRSYRECRSGTSRSPWIRFVPCKNDMECGMRRRCIETGTCNDPVFGDPAARMCSGACEDQSEVAGFYYCEDDSLDVLLGPGAKISWNGFGVSHLRNSSKPSYSRDELLEMGNKAEVLAIIEPETVNSTLTLYQAEVHNFTCVGSSFVFAGGFEWQVVERGNKSYTLEQQSDSNIAELLGTEEVLMDEGFIRMESAIEIRSSDIKYIKCVAHLWNPNIFGAEAVDSMISSINVAVSSAKSPELVVETFKKSYVFDLSEKNWTNKTIRCPVTGKPFPSITWLKDGKSAMPRGVSSEFNKLTFTSVDKNFAGTYTCIASNFGKEVQANFTVQVFESPFDRMPWLIRTVACIIRCVCKIGCLLVLTILIVALIGFWLKIRQQRMLLRNLTEEEIKEFEHGNPDCFDPKAEITDQAHLLAYNGNYEFPKDQLNFSVRDKLGAGEFGLVLKGYAANIFPTEQQTLVAVKTIKASADITQFKSLLTELKIMSRIGRHPNLVNLLGACTKEISKREVYIILEYCANGDLRSYLRDQQRVITQILSAFDGAAKPHAASLPEFVNWAHQIASGMHYLEIQKVIHGDLAARNVLLTETFQAKIGDFGMSRRLYAQNYVKKQKMALPWKWMALESLRDMEFSTKSDVWAYGVTLWEIFSLGAMPWPGVSWTLSFMHDLEDGNRLERPHYATGAIYNIMMSCWERNPDNRPTFDTLMHKFSALMKQYAILQIETPMVPARTPQPDNEYAN